MGKSRAASTVARTTASDSAVCPHCGKTVHVGESNTYSNKLHKAGWFCEHCNMPLDAAALENTNTNYGNPESGKALYEDLKSKIETFQDSI